MDEDDADRLTQSRPRLSILGLEETPLPEFVQSHREQLEQVGGTVTAPPKDLHGLVALYDDYRAATID